MASLRARVLVRLDETLPLTIDEIESALSRRYGSEQAPGIAGTLETLVGLEGSGLVEQVGNGWRLTAMGIDEHARLVRLHESAQGRGEYGF